ncbi:MAG TPA: hypothetical protein VJ572_05675, partial [Azonexus sp.]|nr:hypothetical protein [Azonexus sp.]
MLAALHTHPQLPDRAALARLSHALIVLPSADAIPADCPERALLLATLARRRLEAGDLAEKAVIANTAKGGLRVWLMLDAEKSTFANHSLLREGLALLLDEEPATVDAVICSLAGWMADLAA